MPPRKNLIFMRHLLILSLFLLSSCNNQLDSPASGTPAPGGGTAKKIGHVFIIILENENADSTFSPTSAAPYLAQTLVAQGAFLKQYFGTAHLSLGNYIAMVSGQGPNLQTQTDCQFFSDFNLVGMTTLGPSGQAIGNGCVLPASVPNIADQLEAAQLSWKGYMEDMGNDLARDGSLTCAHPALNSQDKTQSATATDNYAARHNPFMYFHSIINDQARCDAHVVRFEQLLTDLQSVVTTPNYSFITPNLCSDGHDAPCKNTKPGGLASVNEFLAANVPKILASPAFLQDGLLIITFDEAEADPSNPNGSDAGECCGELPGPNAPLPGIFGLGGGRIGAVLLSPLIKPGTVSDVPYNHYSMLRSVEDIFELTHLGYAADSGLKPFGDDVFTNR